jgi:hypothetical protein
MFSGVQVQVLFPPAHRSNLTLYESQSSEICTSEHGIDQSLLGWTPRVSTAIDHWQSCFCVRWILAMFSGVQVQVLFPPAHRSNLTLYESQSSEICTSEHGIDQFLLGLTPRVSTAIDHWQSCFSFCLHGAHSVPIYCCYCTMVGEGIMLLDPVIVPYLSPIPPPANNEHGNQQRAWAYNTDLI